MRLSVDVILKDQLNPARVTTEGRGTERTSRPESKAAVWYRNRHPVSEIEIHSIVNYASEYRYHKDYTNLFINCNVFMMCHTKCFHICTDYHIQTVYTNIQSAYNEQSVYVYTTKENH